MIKVKVPATSANMGPGFDCLGIALNLYNYFTIEETEAGLEIYGCESIYENTNNLVFKSMEKCFDKIGYITKGLKIGIQSDIPIARGLGSSASCILGGVLAANELAGRMLTRDEILELATEIEGHPDNIAPALFGGMVISIKAQGKVYHDVIKLAGGLKFCAIIPDFKLSTAESRAVLPRKISHEDGVFNVGRTALMISAMANGNFDLLHHACEDKLHQHYRGNLIANYQEILDKCHQLNCLGVYLSGAGPSIMVMLRSDDNDFSCKMDGFLNSLKHNWLLQDLQPDLHGASILSDD